MVADAAFDYRSPDLGPRHSRVGGGSGKRVTLSRDYDRETKYTQHYREEGRRTGPDGTKGYKLQGVSTFMSCHEWVHSSSFLAGTSFFIGFISWWEFCQFHLDRGRFQHLPYSNP